MTDDLGFTETVENLCDAVVQKMTRKELEELAWDKFHAEFLDMKLEDILAIAEYYEIDPDSL